ncbi:MAG: hypothetical protein Q8N37_04405 [bacterium]|nr:hypothetical protein [bacterium]
METNESEKFFTNEEYHKNNYLEMTRKTEEQMAVIEEKYKKGNVFIWEGFFNEIKDMEQAEVSAYIKEELQYMEPIDRLTVKSCVGVLMANEAEKKKYGFTY